MAKTPKLSAQEKQWRTESDLETLTRAESIKSDRSRMSAVQKHAGEKAAALNKVAGAATPKKAAPGAPKKR